MQVQYTQDGYLLSACCIKAQSLASVELFRVGVVVCDTGNVKVY